MGFSDIAKKLTGGESRQSEVEEKYPSWIVEPSKEAIDVARGIAEQPYVPYEDQRVAGPSLDQFYAHELARRGYAAPIKAITTAGRTGAEIAGEEWSPEAAQQYMNPFIEAALDPTIRRINEEAMQNAIAGRAGMIGQGGVGAFGDARTAMLEGEIEEARLRGVGDVLGRGYAEAYQTGLAAWQADQARKLEGARLQMDAGTRGAVIKAQKFQDLMATGAIQREIAQKNLDVEYENYLEQRDWNQRGLDAYIRTLSGVPFPTKQKGEESKSDLASTITGYGALAISAIALAMA